MKNYICDYKHVCCAFIDFKKAFDSINRDPLFYRLLSYNIDGKIFKAMKSLYKYTVCTVKINDYITEYIIVPAYTAVFDTFHPLSVMFCQA